MPIVPARRSAKKSARTVDHAANLAWQIEQGLQITVIRELPFHPTRKWKFDLAIDRVIATGIGIGTPVHLAIEIEGGLFAKDQGRHNRGAGMRADMDKYNEAVLLGWRILRVLPEWVSSGKAFGLVARAVKGSR